MCQLIFTIAAAILILIHSNSKGGCSVNFTSEIIANVMELKQIEVDASHDCSGHSHNRFTASQRVGAVLCSVHTQGQG